MSNLAELKALLGLALNNIEGLQAMMNEGRVKAEEAQGTLIIALGDDSGNEVVNQAFNMMNSIMETIDQVQQESQAVYDSVLSYQAVL